MEGQANLPSVSITTEDDRVIKSILEQERYFRSPYEIEFRISSDDKSIGRPQLYDLISYFSSKKEFKREYEKTRVSIDEYDKRQIEFLSENKGTLFQYKTRVKDEHGIELSRVIGNSSGHFNVRFSLSEERKVLSLDGQPALIRTRSRVSFTHTSGGYRVDLSIVEDNTSSEKGYEIEIELLKKQTIREALDPVKHILLVLNNFRATGSLVSKEESIQLVKYFNSLVVHGRRIDDRVFDKKTLPQPVNLKREMISLLRGYSVTDKLNGTRYVLVFSPNGTYLANPARVIKLGPPVQSLLGTVVDLEYYKDKIYAFDILTIKDSLGKQERDVRDMMLTERLKLLEVVKYTLTRDAEWVPFNIKKFYIQTNLSKGIEKIFEEVKKSGDPHSNDGVIFTPIYEPYSKNTRIYKWKQPENLTIDLLLSPNGKNKYDLMVYEVNNWGKEKLVQFKDATFTPSGKEGKIQAKSIGEFGYDKDPKDPLHGGKWVLKNWRHDKILPNFITVAENVWEDIQNPITLDELTMTISSVEIEDSVVRRYHNAIKRELISAYCSPSDSENMATHKVVLDIGIGRGGDLSKYKEAEVRRLYGVDPNEDNLEELKRRLAGIDLDDLTVIRKALEKIDYSQLVGDIDIGNDMALREALRKVPVEKLLNVISTKTKLKSAFQTFSNAVILIHADGGDTHTIVSQVGNKANVVASFFSLTFFFDSKKHLEDLMNTVAQTTGEGSYFIGTTMDGERTMALIESNRQKFREKEGREPDNKELVITIGKSRNNDNTLYNQTLYPDYREPVLDYNKKVIVDMGAGRIVEDQTEYLVIFSDLVDGMLKRGFKLLDSSFFSPPDTFSEEERRFITLNRKFIFEKKKEEIKILLPSLLVETKTRTRPKGDQTLQPPSDETKIVKLYISNKPGEQLEFKSPYGRLIRMATPTDGSCFIHSIIAAKIPNKFKTQTPEERTSNAKTLRKTIADKLSYTVWNNLGDGQIARLPTLSSFFSKLERYFSSESTLLTVNEIRLLQQELASRKYNSLTVAELKEKIPQKIESYYKRPGLIKENLDKLMKIINETYLQVVKEEYTKYKNQLADCSRWVDASMLEIIGEVSGYDVYILDSKGEVYKTGGCIHVKGDRPAILVVWINETHYETVGLVYKNNEGKDVTKFLFKPNEPGYDLILKIKSLAGCDNEKEPEKKVVSLNIE